jgi:hypothetical protein
MGRITLTQRIEQELRRRIGMGIYSSDAYLPSERQLAVEFGTTRRTLRAALVILAKDGLVERSPSRGTRVLSPLGQLTQPLIGIVQVNSLEGQGAPMPWRQDSLATLNGVQDALLSLKLRYEFVFAHPDRGLASEEIRRFGAFLFVEHSEHWGELFDELKQCGVPFIVAKLEDDVDVPCTHVDHEAPAKQAVRMLVACGHRRIAFVGREPGYGCHGKARQGYEVGLRESGIDVDPSLLCVCPNTDALSAFLAVRDVLAMESAPTAVVAARDTLAEGVCRAAEDRGLVIGHDLSVVGFDHLTWPDGEEFLTTFHEPCCQMGSAAVEMLMARIVNPHLPDSKRKFDTPLVTRRSVGPVPAKRKIAERTR